jgi:prepilin-type N-terminal cleavage/methylation domain-containing protein
MAHLRREEGGFTIAEVLVAILILAIGAMTTFALLTKATRNAQRAKAGQIVLEVAEQEMEYLRSLENSKLALKAPPPPSPSELNPNFRVREGEFALTRRPVGNYRQPRPDPLHQRRRQRQDLPLRRLAQRRKLQRNEMSRQT